MKLNSDLVSVTMSALNIIILSQKPTQSGHRNNPFLKAHLNEPSTVTELSPFLSDRESPRPM